MAVTRRDTLKMVDFGNSGMKVTECCIGTMTWGSFNGKEEEAFAPFLPGCLGEGLRPLLLLRFGI